MPVRARPSPPGQSLKLPADRRRPAHHGAWPGVHTGTWQRHGGPHLADRRLRVMVARPQAGSGVRIAELVATLSYASDLGLGQPMAHCMRQTVIALRLGDHAGASDRELEATYYLGLMMNIYCHADAAEQAQWFGDDISLK